MEYTWLGWGAEISPTEKGKGERKLYSLFYSFTKARLACDISTSLWGKPLVFIILLESLEIHVSSKGKKCTQIGMLTLSLSVNKEIIKKKQGI